MAKARLDYQDDREDVKELARRTDQRGNFGAAV
jgi:hypothetical protein